MTILTELTEFKNVKESHQLPRLKKNNTSKAIIYNKYQLQEHKEVILTVRKPSGVEQEKRQSHQVKFFVKLFELLPVFFFVVMVIASNRG